MDPGGGQNFLRGAWLPWPPAGADSVTLKPRLWVTEGRWKGHHSIDHTRLTISRVI